MLNFVKRIAVSVFMAQCILRVYRGPSEAPWIDNGQDQNVLRPLTINECVVAAIVQGATLAEEMIKAIRNGWEQ